MDDAAHHGKSGHPPFDVGVTQMGAKLAASALWVGSLQHFRPTLHAAAPASGSHALPLDAASVAPASVALESPAASFDASVVASLEVAASAGLPASPLVVVVLPQPAAASKREKAKRDFIILEG